MLQAQVIYFPTYFGHIGVNIYNPTNLAEGYFFDFGGMFDIDDDTECYGVDPIVIHLPEVDIGWEHFLAKIAETPYACSSFAEVGKHYSLLRNNCAHAVQQILHIAGYIPKKPPLTFALTPNTVAEQAYAIAKVNFGNQRLQEIEKLFNTSPHEYIKRIATIINSCMHELELEAKIKRNFKHKKTDREILSKIKFDGSEDSIERLMQACETVSDTIGILLQRCLTLLPPNLYLEISIRRLEEKAYYFENNNYPTEANTAITLANSLRHKINGLTAKSITADVFEKESLLAISKAASKLEKHRDCRILLANLALAIIGFGILYLIAATIKKSMTGNFLFFDDAPMARSSSEHKYAPVPSKRHRN